MKNMEPHDPQREARLEKRAVEAPAGSSPAAGVTTRES
jgi:hypothetical protein